MNIFNKVTLQSLKRNKVRTIVTIIGIILSAAMICSVTTVVSSVYNYALEYAIYSYGEWHGSEVNTDYDTYNKIISSDKIKSTVYGKHIGYAIAEGCTNDYKPYIFILGVGEGFNDIMPIHITSGKYPTSSNEIMLPNHLADNGEVKHILGDTLTLEIGDRMTDGFILTQINPFSYVESGRDIIPNEELVVKETKTYTVVGFYERPGFESYSAPGYTAITVDAADTISDNTSATFDVYFQMKNAEDVYSFMVENKLSGDENNLVLAYYGVSNMGEFDVLVGGLSTIVIILIIFGSVSLIYNAFSISVSERTKQFGLLSSIGATKKQLRKMVLFEAFTVSFIGIPLGIFLGIGGIGVTLLYLDEKFQDIMNIPVSLKVHVSLFSIIAAVIIALVTVLLSVWIPAIRATRVSAVEAIRQNTDIYAKRKSLKTSKIIYRLFGLPGALASKYYKRSRKKYRATVISLFMSIVLFVSASAFSDYLIETANFGFKTSNYDIKYFCSVDDFTNISMEDLLSLMREDAGITSAMYMQDHADVTKIPKTLLSREAIKYSDGISWSRDDDNGIYGIYLYFSFIDDQTFKDLLREYNLNESEYYDKSAPKAIALDACTLFDVPSNKNISFNILESDNGKLSFVIPDNDIMIIGPEISESDNNNNNNNNDNADNPSDTSTDKETSLELEYGKVIHTWPYYLEPSSGIQLIYPYSMAKVLSLDEILKDYDVNFFFKSDDHNASYDALKETLNEYGFSRLNLYDIAEREEQNRNMITIIQVFSYGFIVLISLIAAANVFNTISTNISLRRRDFAMLKSVGMTSKDINKMMNFECLLYGIKSLLYGLPVSTAITYLIYKIVCDGYDTTFRLPLIPMVIASLSVFVVVFATMMYSMSKIKKENPIDALKNENI